MRKLIMAVVALAAAGAGWFGNTLVSQEPYCPTEDSCHVDYNGDLGRWIIYKD